MFLLHLPTDGLKPADGLLSYSPQPLFPVRLGVTRENSLLNAITWKP